jgi:hypothetical protein
MCDFVRGHSGRQAVATPAFGRERDWQGVVSLNDQLNRYKMYLGFYRAMVLLCIVDFRLKVARSSVISQMYLISSNNYTSLFNVYIKTF